MSCVEPYSPGAVAGRAFAFDGTVTRIGRSRSNRGAGGDLNLSAVSFRVGEWFHGGSGVTVTVDLDASGGRADLTSQSPPVYRVGTRLLVSGEHRWGGTTMSDAIAWPCGFTRPYRRATADTWRRVDSAPTPIPARAPTR